MSRTQFANSIEALFPGIESQLRIEMLPTDPSIGAFDNHVGSSGVTRTHLEAWYRVAALVSTEVAARFPELSGCDADDRACATLWAVDLARSAWRSDEDPGLEELLASFDQWWDSGGAPVAVSGWVQLVLLSPEFIYFPEFGDRDGRLTSDEVATRLAYLIWDGPPDDALLRAASVDALQDPSAVETQARRMLESPRAERGVLNFYRQVLDWDRFGTLDLDAQTYFPEMLWDNAANLLHLDLQPAMRLEAEQFVRVILLEEGGRFGDLLTSSRTWVNAALAERVYQVDLPEGVPGERLTGEKPPGVEFRYESEFFPVELSPEERAGVLTLSGFLHSNAHPQQPAPVLRGAFVLDRLLCAPASPPPADVPPLENTTAAEIVTNRDRYAAHTSNPACAGCHVGIDGIGFGFENYDSLGRYRTHDNGEPVDASGALFGTDQDGPFNGGVDLAHALATSRTAHDCHVLQWFRYAYGRSETAADEAELERLQDSFWDSGGNVQELIVTLVTSESFLSIPEPHE